MPKEMIYLLRYVDNFQWYRDVNSDLLVGNIDGLERPYVTIAIPTFRRPHLLRHAICSSLNQVNPGCEFEVIVVDNEPEPARALETEKLIRSYRDKRLLYYRNERNIGMVGNWNRCLELARGTWVAFLHDDDILKQDYLSNVTQILGRKQDMGALIPAVKTTEVNCMGEPKQAKLSSDAAKELGRNRRQKLIRLRPTDNHIFASNVYGAPTCGFLLRRELAISEGGFNEQFFPSADWFFMYKFNHQHSVFKILDVLGEYRIGENESLNPETLKGFVEKATLFKDCCRKHSILAAAMYTIFRYEQHCTFVDWMRNYDKSLSIKPTDYNYMCEYRKRGIMLTVYKAIRTLYWRLKAIDALILD